MPTSFPRNYPEVRFPYDFTQLYDKPFAYYPSAHAHRGAGLRSATFDGLSPNSINHRNKYMEEQAMVDERIRQKQVRRLNQLTANPGRVMAYTVLEEGSGKGGCMSCEPGDRGGARYGTADGQIEGAPVLAGRGLLGGVMRTQAGRQFLQSRLTARIKDLNAIEAAKAGIEQVEEPPTEQDLTADDEAVSALGEYLEIISDAMASANWSKDATDAARKFVSTLLKIGWRIPQNSITPMLREVSQYIAELRRYFLAGNVPGAFNLSAEKLRQLRNTFLLMERARAVLEYLSTKSTLSPDERRMALNAFKPRLAKLVRAQQLYAAPGRAVPPIPAGRPAPPVPAGRYAEIFPARAVPAWYRRNPAVPGRVLLEPDVGDELAQA